MNKRLSAFLLVLAVMFSALPSTAEASIFSKALDKARKVMQGAFQMSFLSSVPVIFYKDSFNKMTDYVNDTIDNMDKEYNGKRITTKDIQEDKQTHIKKSAELALHIKSLTGSKYLAYGLTLLVGLTKEAIDGSFLNPNGGRCIEDFYADIVGAKAVFGEEAVNKALDKYMGSFIKEGVLDKKEETAATTTVGSTEEAKTENSTVKLTTKTPSFVEDEVDRTNSEELKDINEARELLMQEYYKAAQRGDTAAVQVISEQLKNLQ